MDKDGCRKLWQPLVALDLFGDRESSLNVSPKSQQGSQNANRVPLQPSPASVQGPLHTHLSQAGPSCHIPATDTTCRQERDEGLVWGAWGRSGKGQEREDLENRGPFPECIPASPLNRGWREQWV